MMILAARFGEDNLLSSMQDKLQWADILEEDNISPLYLLIRGGGQHAQVNIPLNLGGGTDLKLLINEHF